MAQFPIIVNLRHSSIWQWLLRGLHGILFLEIMLVPWSLPVRLTLLAGVLASAGRCEREERNATTLELSRKGKMYLRLATNGDCLPGQIHSTALIHPWLTIFTMAWHESGKHSEPQKCRSRVMVVLPDSASTTDFRRLRVWLKWENHAAQRLAYRSAEPSTS